MKWSLAHLTVVLTFLGAVIAAPLDLEPRQEFKPIKINPNETKSVTPNGQKEAEGGIDIPIGILGMTTRVRMDDKGVPSVPLWGQLGPNHRDVRQGGMPDCWLDVAMVAMAMRYPSFFISRFGTKDGQIYSDYVNVILTLEGKKHVYSVNYLDAALSKDLLGQNSAGSVYWWPAAVETAVQRLYNDKGQPNIFKTGGYPAKALEMLSGVPSGAWLSDDKEKIWRHLKLHETIPVLITTKGEDKGGTKTLIPYHAYTIEGTEEIDGQRLVTVRNPWQDTQRHKLEDIINDMSSYIHYRNPTAVPTNEIGNEAVPPSTESQDPEVDAKTNTQSADGAKSDKEAKEGDFDEDDDGDAALLAAEKEDEKKAAQEDEKAAAQNNKKKPVVELSVDDNPEVTMEGDSQVLTLASAKVVSS